MRRLVFALAVLMPLVGCAAPGSTIDVVSSNSAAVTLEYTHSYSFELGETIKAAERACVAYGKHAVMASNTRINMDRSVAMFRCVA